MSKWFKPYNVLCSETGKITLNVKVPDTITSWVATAFAVNPDTGLGLTPQPANVSIHVD